MSREKSPTASSESRRRSPRKPAASAIATITSTQFVDQTRRSAMIAEAAYYRAERRGFSAGHEVEDWLGAEHDIDGLLFGAQERFARV